MITLADAEEALIYHAEECEKCLRSAWLGTASLHSEAAFELSRAIVQLRRSA